MVRASADRNHFQPTGLVAALSAVCARDVILVLAAWVGCRVERRAPCAGLLFRLFRKPFCLELCERPIAAQGLYCSIDCAAQVGAILGESDPELLAGGDLQGYRELRTVLDQPGDHRE